MQPNLTSNPMQKPQLTRTVAFLFKGSLTLLEVPANDPRLDSTIISQFKARLKLDKVNIRARNKALKVSKDFRDCLTPGAVYPAPSLDFTIDKTVTPFTEG